MTSHSGRTWTIHGAFQMPGIYETGGAAINLPSNKDPVTITLIFRAGPSGGYHFHYEDGKIQAWHSVGAGPLEEVPAGTNLSGVTVRFKAVLA